MCELVEGDLVPLTQLSMCHNEENIKKVCLLSK